MRAGERILPRDCNGDPNFDKVVDGIDLGLLLGGWGNCPQ